MVAKPENPWHPREPYDPPAWRMRRRQALFKVECPACGGKGRPYYVGDGSTLVRCMWCGEKFDAEGRRCS